MLYGRTRWQLYDTYIYIYICLCLQIQAAYNNIRIPMCVYIYYYKVVCVFLCLCLMHSYMVCMASHVEKYAPCLLKQRWRGHLYFRPPKTLRWYLTGRSDMDDDAAGRYMCVFLYTYNIFLNFFFLVVYMYKWSDASNLLHASPLRVYVYMYAIVGPPKLTTSV
jgi:hypothetical protein